MGQTVVQGPMADLGAVEFEGMEAQDFRGGETVRTRRRASQPSLEEVKDWLRPGGGVVATGTVRHPQAAFALGARPEKIAGKNVETAA